MTRGTRVLNSVLRSNVTVTVLAVATIGSFLISVWPGTATYWVFAIPLAGFASCFVYSLVIRVENQALRDCARIVHGLNHLYRDVLCTTLTDKTQISTEYMAERERKTLEAACQRIASLYSVLTGKSCVVTVKLIIEEDGKYFCTTLARSELNSERDRRPQKFEINAGTNTAFDTALRFTQGVSHFFSADMIKDEKRKEYFNTRTDWKRFYKSAIVVPIRVVHYDDLGKPKASDDLGFLSVDTFAKSRLNNGFHVEYLAAFADQMFNFMSLMRRKYRLVDNPALP